MIQPERPKWKFLNKQLQKHSFITGIIMQVESWKEPLLKLPIDELRKAQCFVTDLIQTLETLQTKTEGSIVIFPPEDPLKIEERRRDKRFDMEIEGVCSLVKKQESEVSKESPIIIRDISKRGLRFITSQSLMPSDVLVVTFQLPGNNSGWSYL